MKEIEKIQNSILDAETALRHLEFTIRFEGYCNRSPQSASLAQFLDELNISHDCDLPEGMVHFDNPFSEQDLIMHSGIAIWNALAISSQVLNRLYEEADVKVEKGPPKDQDGAVRLYINQVRNIFQHTAGSPVWDIIPKKQVQIELEINGKETNIDFAELHGKEFEYSQIGGLRLWIEASEYAISRVKALIDEPGA